VLPIATLALTAVALMVLTGCLPMRSAYNAIDFSIIVLIAGMLALGLAIERTQIAHAVSTSLVSTLSQYGPVAVLAGIYVMAMVVTAVVSNNAVAVLMTPIALDAAVTMEVHPAPFLYGVLFGASACFATPIGYQTNLFVYGPGGYRFADYLRLGTPLNLLLLLAALVVLPWWFPFAGPAS
jgi:di/tricarboxylate transporter